MRTTDRHHRLQRIQGGVTALFYGFALAAVAAFVSLYFIGRRDAAMVLNAAWICILFAAILVAVIILISALGSRGRADALPAESPSSEPGGTA